MGVQGEDEARIWTVRVGEVPSLPARSVARARIRTVVPGVRAVYPVNTATPSTRAAEAYPASPGSVKLPSLSRSTSRAAAADGAKPSRSKAVAVASGATS